MIAKLKGTELIPFFARHSRHGAHFRVRTVLSIVLGMVLSLVLSMVLSMMLGVRTRYSSYPESLCEVLYLAKVFSGAQ